MRSGLQLVTGLVLSCLSLATLAETTPAVWKEKELTFTYHGFTTNYSCDGLKHKVRAILTALGARRDPQIRVSGCELGGGVAIAPRVRVRAAFPEALPAQGTDAQSFAARTDMVTLAQRRPRGLEAGDCELVEQLRARVFPEIGSKVLADRTACIPHQLSLGQPYLRLEILRPASVTEGTTLTD